MRSKRATNRKSEAGGANQALTRFIDSLVERRFHTSSALAEAIGMSLSAFSRAYREEGTLSVENCLRLAAAIGERPGKILRLCRRNEIAKIADQLFGENETTLTRREREHLALWRMVDGTAHDAIDALLQMPAVRVGTAAGDDARTAKRHSPESTAAGEEEERPEEFPSSV